MVEQYNTPGFVGCLSRVQFNGVAPIKSALRSRAPARTTPAATQPSAASPVSYQGKLVESNCGASPLTIPPMSAATDPWHLDSTGERRLQAAIGKKTDEGAVNGADSVKKKQKSKNRTHAAINAPDLSSLTSMQKLADGALMGCLVSAVMMSAFQESVCVCVCRRFANENPYVMQRPRFTLWAAAHLLHRPFNHAALSHDCAPTGEKI